MKSLRTVTRHRATRALCRRGFGLILLLQLAFFPVELKSEEISATDESGYSGVALYNSITTIFNQNYYLALSRNLPLESATRLNLILETRYIYSFRRDPLTGNSEPSGESEQLLSAEVENPNFYFSLGRRFQPGPRSYFKSDPSLYSGFYDLPPARNSGQAFLQLGRKLLLPGLYFTEESKKPGLYFIDRDESFWLLYHHHHRQGLLTVDRTFNSGSHHLYLDLDCKRRNCQGYGSLKTIAPEQPLQLNLEMERQRDWDFTDREKTIINKRRSGRSAQGGGSAVYLEKIGAELATQQRDRLGLHLGGLELRPELFSSGWRLLLRGRYYRRQLYSNENQGATTPQQYDYSSYGLGVMSKSEQNHFFLLLEKKKKGATHMEMGWQFKRRELGFQLSLLLLDDYQADSFFLLKSDYSYEGNLHFYRSERGALLFRVKNRYLYFALSTLLQPDGKLKHNSSLQMRFIF